MVALVIHGDLYAEANLKIFTFQPYYTVYMYRVHAAIEQYINI